MEKLIAKQINNQTILFYEVELENLDRNMDTIKNWCKERLMPYMDNKKINGHHSSYGLKHICEKELGFYVSNGQIKAALAELGVRHYQAKDCPNCYYPIRESFYNQLQKKPSGDIYTVPKSDIKRIVYKDDVDIIYLQNDFKVCQKGSIKDFGTNIAFIYDNKKGKSDK